MAAQPDILLQCFDNASSAAKPALARCVDHAIAELQLLESKSLKLAERDALAATWRNLLVNKKSWSERYSVDLLAEFKQEAAEKPPAASAAAAVPAAFTRPGLASFGLVDDADLNQAIDGQRLLQNLLPGVEQSLAELNALVSSALGLGYVAPEKNPMRPEVFTRVLQRLASHAVEGGAEAAQSFKYLTQPLGQELVQIYAATIKALKQASVTAASYQYRLQPATPTPQNNPGAASAPVSGRARGQARGQAQGQAQGQATSLGAQDRGDTAASRPVDLSDVYLKADLLRDFLSGNGRRVDFALSAPYYDDIEQELADLKAAPDSAPADLSSSAQARMAEIAQLPAVDRPQRRVDGSSALSEQVWGPYGTSRARAIVRTQLKKQATHVSQALSLEVVRELVNQVAQDPRLLAPVREAIVALEPSLLRLALVDPRFFSDERHPGRQLMERTAQRSFKYNDEFNDEFAEFFRGICHGFKRLNGQEIESAQPFAAVLAELEQTWDAHDQVDSDKRQQVLDALRFAEERQTKADQIAFDLSARSDLQQVPGKVLDFLFGPWALVMAHARLSDTRNQIDPQGYGSIVPDLVWSVKRDVTLKQPAKLIEMIPGLLDKLHSGLALLGQDPKENDAFFESLMKLHRPVLKLRRLKSQRDAQESSAALLEPEEPWVAPAQRLENLRAQADAPLWLGRGDLDAAGFEDTLPTDLGELSGAIPDPQQELPVLTDAVMPASVSDVQPEPGGQEPVVVPDAQTPNSDTEQAKDQAKEQAAATLRGLKTGHWVDLYSKHQWLRAQLVWASSKATLFMFISHGGRPHSMTQRSCEKLIAQRLLRPVGTQGVIAQALDGVAEVTQAQGQVAKADASAGNAGASPRQLATV
jgi:hypothetical protein